MSCTSAATGATISGKHICINQINFLRRTNPKIRYKFVDSIRDSFLSYYAIIMHTIYKNCEGAGNVLDAIAVFDFTPVGARIGSSGGEFERVARVHAVFGGLHRRRCLTCNECAGGEAGAGSGKGDSFTWNSIESQVNR